MNFLCDDEVEEFIRNITSKESNSMNLDIPIFLLLKKEVTLYVMEMWKQLNSSTE